jgi:hypothetical protein
MVVRDARQLAANVNAKAFGRQGFAGRVAPQARRPTEDTAISGAAVPLLPLQQVNGPGAWHVAGAEHECALDLGRVGHGKPQLPTAAAGSPPEQHLNEPADRACMHRVKQSGNDNSGRNWPAIVPP